MLNGFQANPEGLIQRGNDIKQVFTDYDNERVKVGQTIDNVAASWEGADSSGYVSQIHSYDADFQKLGTVIERIGIVLNQHGQRLAKTRDGIRNAASRL